MLLSIDAKLNALWTLMATLCEWTDGRGGADCMQDQQNKNIISVETLEISTTKSSHFSINSKKFYFRKITIGDAIPVDNGKSKTKIKMKSQIWGRKIYKLKPFTEFRSHFTIENMKKKNREMLCVCMHSCVWNATEHQKMDENKAQFSRKTRYSHFMMRLDEVWWNFSKIWEYNFWWFFVFIFLFDLDLVRISYLCMKIFFQNYAQP